MSIVKEHHMAPKKTNKGTKRKRKINFDYKISPNYCIYSITGVYGGLNAQGDIIASFFSERAPIPSRITFEIKGNELGGQIAEQKRDAIIRDVIVGFAIKPSVARIFAKWLIEKADEYDKIMKVLK